MRHDARWAASVKDSIRDFSKERKICKKDAADSVIARTAITKKRLEAFAPGRKSESYSPPGQGILPLNSPWGNRKAVKRL
jgi:hypothetical protein